MVQIEDMTQYDDNPSFAYCTKYVITAVNKQRTAINCAAVRPWCGSGWHLSHLSSLGLLRSGLRMANESSLARKRTHFGSPPPRGANFACLLRGELTLWNGLTFNFDAILPVCAVAALFLASDELLHRPTKHRFELFAGVATISGLSVQTTLVRVLLHCLSH